MRVKALPISLHLSRNKVPFDLFKSNLILFVSKIGHYSLKEIREILQNGPEFGIVIVGGYVFVYTAFSAVMTEVWSAKLA